MNTLRHFLSRLFTTVARELAVRLLFFALAIVPVCLAGSSALAAELFKLTADRAYYGNLAMSGSTALIGGPASVYVFDLTTGQQRTLLTSPNGQPGDSFGSSFAVDGDRALVVNGSRAVARHFAYIFDVNTGQPLHTTKPSENSYEFGISTAISGNRAIVGSDLFQAGWGNGTGGAFVFDVTTGEQTHLLTPSDVDSNDNFSIAMAIDGDLGLFGDNGDGEHGLVSGAGYLFDLNSGRELLKITPTDSAPGMRFGYNVALDDGFALVTSKVGDTYVFDATSGQQLLKIANPDNTGSGAYIPKSISVCGNLALVGRRGAADLFSLPNGELLKTFVNSDSTPGDEFGQSVQLNDKFAVIGAHGAAYVFGIGVPEPAALNSVVVSLTGLMLTTRFSRRVRPMIA